MKRILDAVWSLVRSLTRLSEVLEALTAETERLDRRIDELDVAMGRLSGKLEVIESLLEHR
jgi:prefoldin subunit 5